MDVLLPELWREVFLHVPVADLGSVRLVSNAWFNMIDQAFWRARWNEYGMPSIETIVTLAKRFRLHEEDIRYLCNLVASWRNPPRVRPRSCASAHQRARWHSAAHFLGLFSRTVSTRVEGRVAFDSAIPYRYYAGSDNRTRLRTCTITVQDHYDVVIAARPSRLPGPAKLPGDQATVYYQHSMRGTWREIKKQKQELILQAEQARNERQC